jgi:hypothetical protein
VSKFSTVYDALVALPGLLFTGGNVKTEIPNPYSLEDNMQQFLYKSWGLKIGPADYALDRSCNSHLAINHQFSYILTYEIIRLDGDISEIHQKIKAIKEDAQTLSMRLHREDELGLPSDVSIIELGSVSDIIFVQADKTKLISIEIPFTITIMELIQ